MLCLEGSLAAKKLIEQNDKGGLSEIRTLEPESSAVGILDAEKTTFRALQILEHVRFGHCEIPSGLPAPLKRSASPEQNGKPNKLNTREICSLIGRCSAKNAICI